MPTRSSASRRVFTLVPLVGIAAFAIHVTARAPEPASSDAVARAAQAFLATLDEASRAKATYPLEDEERFDWHFIPRTRNGLPLKSMSVEQRTAAHAMLQAALSTQGYLKANAVIELERILGVLENRPERRDHEQYFVTIFGSPISGDPWAWRFEGHHLSLNFTAATNELVVMGPAFMGANPATVPSGPKAGWRALAREEDLARSLVHALSADQRRTAIIATEAPRDIITGADRDAKLEGFEGLQASAMNEAQRHMLFQLIAEYVDNMNDEASDRWTQRIHHDLPPEQIYFAWAGSVEPGEGHYYRVQTPLFLIEYDNTQGNANHIHSVWRDLENDFGEDLLKKHYEEADHRH